MDDNYDDDCVPNDFAVDAAPVKGGTTYLSVATLENIIKLARPIMMLEPVN